MMKFCFADCSAHMHKYNTVAQRQTQSKQTGQQKYSEWGKLILTPHTHLYGAFNGCLEQTIIAWNCHGTMNDYNYSGKYKIY